LIAQPNWAHRIRILYSGNFQERVASELQQAGSSKDKRMPKSRSVVTLLSENIDYPPVRPFMGRGSIARKSALKLILQAFV
jgi:hypothetical protein